MRHTKCWIVAVASLLALAPFSSAKNPSEVKAEKDRLQNSGKVVQEILNVPEDIPQDMIDKARCVVVMPSVLKAAFLVGGSYGRGTTVCRTGKNSPVHGRACYVCARRRELWLAVWRRGNRLRLSRDKRSWRRQPAAQQGKAGSGRIIRRRTKRTFRGSRF